MLPIDGKDPKSPRSQQFKQYQRPNLEYVKCKLVEICRKNKLDFEHYFEDGF